MGDISFYSSGITMAPMAGVTDTGFRRTCRRLGATCLVTEMVTAAGLSRRSVKSKKMLVFHPEEEPIGVQLFGAKPDDFARSAALVSPLGFSFIDINAGCPVKRVLKSGSGSALLGDIPRLMEVIRSTAENTHLPVTVKIRLGLDPGSPVPVEIGAMAAEAGASVIAVHGRYRTDFFSGEVRLDEMRAIADASPIPMVANGDSTSVEAALRMKGMTGASGLLIGRGAWGNPWIFRGLSGGNPLPGPGELQLVMTEQLSMRMETVPEPQVYHIFRGHMVQYFRGFRGAAEFRKRAVASESFQEIRQICREADEAMHREDMAHGE